MMIRTHSQLLRPMAVSFLLITTHALGQSVYPTGVTVNDSKRTYDGYTFYQAPDGKAVLIDMLGDVVQTWETPVDGDELVFAEPLDNGHVFAMSRPLGSGSFGSRAAFELDWEGNVVASFVLPAGLKSMHHDMVRLDNGNTLILCNADVPAPQISKEMLIDDLIIEVTPAGKLVWDWHLRAHFDELEFSTAARKLIYSSGGDWAHANAISVIPENEHRDPAFAPGNIIMSLRVPNTIIIIDRQTGDIVWKSGPNGPLTLGQHHPYMLDDSLPGAGNILVFDNGSGLGYPPQFARSSSRAVEIDPTTMDIVWSYDATNSKMIRWSFYSDIVSSAQRLPNGNTFIVEGTKGRLFEVDSTGTIVWEYMNDRLGTMGADALSPMVYRAYRLDYDWVPR